MWKYEVLWHTTISGFLSWESWAWTFALSNALKPDHLLSKIFFWWILAPAQTPGRVSQLNSTAARTLVLNTSDFFLRPYPAQIWQGLERIPPWSQEVRGRCALRALCVCAGLIPAFQPWGTAGDECSVLYGRRRYVWRCTDFAVYRHPGIPDICHMIGLSLCDGPDLCRESC